MFDKYAKSDEVDFAKFYVLGGEFTRALCKSDVLLKHGENYEWVARRICKLGDDGER